jgi:hypothetical protein
MTLAPQILVEEENLEVEPEEAIPYQYSITSYGVDYPVDSLVRRIQDGSVYVPRFQRGYVWSLTQASRFVESLLLGLPVPGIFLSREEETQKLLVIDGQQRLRTLQFYYEGIFADSGREFSLRGIDSRFTGTTYKTLREEDRRRLDDSVLHATVIRQDEPSDDDSSIYHIFERLNTGGTSLLPQEIRACIYHGEFNELLKELNSTKSWRLIYGPISSRMRDQELILRFFALYSPGAYEKPMKSFLNSYMGRNRHLKLQSREQLTSSFVGTIDTVFKCIGNNAFKPKRALNAAVFDAVMVGLARRLERGPIAQTHLVKQRYDELLKNTEFVNATEYGTSDEDSVRRRLALVTDVCADLP